MNNAGYGFTGGIEETGDEEIRELFETNYFGAAALTRAILPQLRSRHDGYIINISSIAAIAGMAASGWYCASKAALELFSEALAREVAGLGIRTMIVEQGAFHTDFADRSRRHAASPLDHYPSANASKSYLDEKAWANAHLPATGVHAILSAMDADNPPLRLLLGRSAVAFAQAALQKRLEGAAAWRKASSLDN